MEGTTLSNTASAAATAAAAAAAMATVAHITAVAAAETEWVSKWSAKSINAVGSRSFVRRRRGRRVKPSESDRMARFTPNTYSTVDAKSK